jgi:hypothetical protein
MEAGPWTYTSDEPLWVAFGDRRTFVSELENSFEGLVGE